MPDKYISLKVGAPLPKSLGRCADAYKEVKAVRLDMDKDVKMVKARESEINEYIIDNLGKSDLTGAAGLKFKAQIVPGIAGTVIDWELLYDYIVENDRFDLLNKSLNQKAVKEMLDAGDKIPGVEKINTKKLSITKV